MDQKEFFREATSQELDALILSRADRELEKIAKNRKQKRILLKAFLPALGFASVLGFIWFGYRRQDSQENKSGELTAAADLFMFPEAEAVNDEMISLAEVDVSLDVDSEVIEDLEFVLEWRVEDEGQDEQA